MKTLSYFCYFEFHIVSYHSELSVLSLDRKLFTWYKECTWDKNKKNCFILSWYLENSKIRYSLIFKVFWWYLWSLSQSKAVFCYLLSYNRIEPKIEKILWKNWNGFWRNRSMTSPILTICQILEGVCAKNLEATLLFVNFSMLFDFIHRGKMGQILLAYGLSKETVTAIMMLYKNMKVKVRSLDGGTDYVDIVAGVLQGDPLALYLFIISLDYMLRTFIDLMKENGFKRAKERSRRYSAQTITDADYGDDMALLANLPAQAEFLLHSLEWAAGGIDHHVNTN